nr:MAG TPA: hypothetical protein [Bacteriophage sp.]
MRMLWFGRGIDEKHNKQAQNLDLYCSHMRK